jgi:colanic acid/amylovoran biosynthesis glycosyltransferase
LGYAKEACYKVFHRLPGQMLKSLKEIGPSIIHAHFAVDAVYAIPIARALGVPLLVSLHGYDVTTSDESFKKSPNLSERLVPGQRHLLHNSGAHYLAVSNFIRNSAISKGFPADQIQVHYIGVDTKEFSSESPVSSRGKRVLFVGRLVEKKGCEFLIRAMSVVQNRMPDAELMIIGTGPLEETLAKLAEDVSCKCRFVGAQPSDIVKEHLSRSRVFCVPSVVAQNGDAEGFGIVFVEAQAMGVPVVSFRTGGIPDAVAHGETGFLNEEGDVAGLARSIEMLLADDGLWSAFSGAGRKRVQESFCLRTQTEKLELIYDDLINRLQCEG